MSLIYSKKNKDSEIEEAKSYLMSVINECFEQESKDNDRMIQSRLAELIGGSTSDIYGIKYGVQEHFTIDRLMRYCRNLGHDIDIGIAPRNKLQKASIKICLY